MLTTCCSHFMMPLVTKDPHAITKVIHAKEEVGQQMHQTLLAFKHNPKADKNIVIFLSASYFRMFDKEPKSDEIRKEIMVLFSWSENQFFPDNLYCFS